MREAMADLDGTRSIEISATPERCFAIAADLDHLPEWHGAMTHVEVLERDGDGRGTLVDSQLDATVAQVRMRLRFSYDEATGVQWTRESGDLRSLEGSWRFEERGDGLTLATYALEIGVGRRLALLVRTVRGPARDRVQSLLVDRPVEGLKARAEAPD
jgi:ribosome-associated toxin RatA of RatAB toxin-antitoxin module